MDSLFTLSDGGELIVSFHRGWLVYNIFDPVDDGFLLGGVRNRDESFISHIELTQRNQNSIDQFIGSWTIASAFLRYSASERWLLFALRLESCTTISYIH